MGSKLWGAFNNYVFTIMYFFFKLTCMNYIYWNWGLLRRQQKFEKIPRLVLSSLIVTSKLRTRYLQILWSSQNIWTLQNIWNVSDESHIQNIFLLKRYSLWFKSDAILQDIPNGVVHKWCHHFFQLGLPTLLSSLSLLNSPLY